MGGSSDDRRRAMRLMRFGEFVWDGTAEVCLHCSEEMARLFGLSVAEFMANRGTTASYLQFVHPEDRQELSRSMYRAAVGAVPCEIEYRCYDAEGRTLRIRQVTEPVPDDKGAPGRTFGTVQDITDIRRSDEALQQREALLRSVTDNIPACLAFFDSELRYRFVNRRAEQWYGRRAAEIVGRHVSEIIDSASFERMRPNAEAALAGQYVRFEVDRRIFPDGSERSVDISYVPHFNRRGEVEGFFALIHDITERKRAQRALQRTIKSGELLRRIATAASEAAGAEEAIAECLKAFGQFGGWNVAGAFVPVDDGLADLAPAGLWWVDDCERCGRLERAVRDGTVTPGLGLPGRVAASGSPEWIRSMVGDPAENTVGGDEVSGFGFPVLANGELAAVLAFFSFAPRESEQELIDLSAQASAVLGRVIERQRADRALSEREQRIRLITDNLPALIAYVDSDLRVRFANETTTVWYGRPASQIIGRELSEFFGPENLKRVAPYIERALAGAVVHFEERLDYADGAPRNVEATYVPHFDDEGVVRGFFSLVTDVTDRVQRETELRHAQKMEAVGKLTGGIAHEFNNQLAVIAGNVELLRDRPDDFMPALDAITRAAERGSELTQRLLSFSRQQPLRPDVVDLPVLVEALAPTLARMLGETVRVDTAFGKKIWPARADRGQLENAILNLAVNARDAMPHGGTLLLRIRNVRITKPDVPASGHSRAGEYVVLSVADDGHGMPPEVLEHAFEPFFTTKGVGEGSGLGLSMVYGFAQQSGGFVEIESKPGAGTMVAIHLPRATGQLERDSRQTREMSVDNRGGTILVVEDDPDVLRLTVALLSSLGYAVLEAPDAEHALRLLACNEAIDMLLSDVVLPGKLSGPAVAEAARRLRPDLCVLFMSGYAADVIRTDPHGRGGHIDADMLSKPFTRAELARKVRSTLETRPPLAC